MCGSKLRALLDLYAYSYRSGSDNSKGLVWYNHNPKIGSGSGGGGLTAACSNCNNIIYRITIDEGKSPLIRYAKLQKPVGDIGYYVRAHELYEKLEEYGGNPDGIPVGTIGPKPTPVSPVVDYFTGSLMNVMYRPKPYAHVYCPVCNEPAKW